MTFVQPLPIVPIYSAITFILNLKRKLGTETFHSLTQIIRLRYRYPDKIKKWRCAQRGFQGVPLLGPKLFKVVAVWNNEKSLLIRQHQKRDTVKCWHEKLCWVKYSPSLKGFKKFLRCCIITWTDLLVANQFFAHQEKHFKISFTHCLVIRRKCKRLKQWEKIDKEHSNPMYHMVILMFYFTL